MSLAHTTSAGRPRTKSTVDVDFGPDADAAGLAPPGRPRGPRRRVEEVHDDPPVAALRALGGPHGAQLLPHSGEGGARRRGPLAPGLGNVPVGRRAGAGLHGGPADLEAV